MKFEEKLMKLRKERGLSQEDLGEGLNVTRQTISKWELGQSKPDMEKLLEISKFFNVSVESLTDDERNPNGGINSGNKIPLTKILIIVGVIILIILVIKVASEAFLLNKLGNPFEMINNVFNNSKEMQEEILDTMDKITEQYNDEENHNKESELKEEFDNQINEMNENYDNKVNEMMEDYNNKVE